MFYERTNVVRLDGEPCVCSRSHFLSESLGDAFDVLSVFAGPLVITRGLNIIVYTPRIVCVILAQGPC